MNQKIDLSNATILDIERETFQFSFYEFVKAAWPTLEPGTPLIENWHLDAVCQHLEAVADGRITRLAISLPPGHNKSLLVGVFFNAWVWTHSPHKRFLSTGSSEGFCERDNGKLRLLINSEWYQTRWPMSFPQVNTVLRFENNSTGFRWAKSYSSLTGGRANFLILDDVLPVDQGNSEIERNKVNRRFFESATSRLESENDGIIIIMQRVHEDDLIGQILERQRNGENLGFDVLSIPMEYGGDDAATSIGWTDPRATYGELICPAYRSQAWVDREKVSMGVYAFSSQYNQEPVPRGDGFFKEEDFKRYRPANKSNSDLGELPRDLVHYVCTDHALGLSAKGDFNAVRVWGVDKDKNHWLVDSFHERCPFNKALGITLKDGKYSLLSKGALPFIKKYKAVAWFADADNIVKSNKAMIDDARISTGAYCRFEIVPNGGRDKVERASSYQSMTELGKIYVPYGAMGDETIAAAVGFPNLKHDDLIDADGLLPRMRTHGAFVAAVEQDWRDEDYITIGDTGEDESSASNFL